MQLIKKRKISLFLMPVLAGLILSVLVLLPVQRADAAAVKATGIDVSRWQGTIDWAAAAADGVDFAMVGIGRYTGGVRIPDPMFDYNMTNAIANGIDVGVYLYSQAVTVAQARSEAEFVLDQIDGYRISYPVVFDMEYSGQTALTTEKRTKIALAFLQVIEQAGYHPAIYASESWFSYYMDMSQLAAYDLWVAKWINTSEKNWKKTYRPAYSGMTMWQYSSTGTVSGISAAVDLDYCYVNYSSKIIPRTTAVSRSSTTTAKGWYSDGTNYWYADANGTALTSQWLKVKKKTYYLDENGYRVTGWKIINGKYYYFNKNGVMKTGWVTVSEKRYYLDPTTGARQTGLITVDGKTYYLNKNGVRKTGWRSVGKKTYYFNPSTGTLVKKNWVKVSGKSYYVNKNGVRVTGWKKISKKWYYFSKTTGEMLKNATVGKYVIGADGVCMNR